MESSTSPSLTERVQVVLAEAIRVPLELVTPTLAFGELPEWDSMAHMEVMLLLEQYFGIEINAETIASLTSVPAICQHLQENGYAQ